MRLAVGAVISAVCLILLFRDVQPRRLLAVFVTVDQRWLVVSVLAVAPAFVATTLRWRLLLLPAGGVPVWRAGRLLALAYLLNLVFPARPGDVLRCYLVGRPTGPAFGTALTTVVVEKALDGAAVVVMLLLLLGQVTPLNGLHHAVDAAGLVFTVLLLAAVALAAGGDRSGRLAARLLCRRPVLARSSAAVLDRVRAGTGAFTRPGLLIGILVLTVVIWLATLATAFSLAAAFG
ncbi:MAG TPA: lysylphosphatidylglycerol synthase domain-containing protein, partial [Chloroflexota bacterium]